MKDYKLVKLKFLSSIHIGSDILDVGKEAVGSILHSDTLFSALVNTYSQLVSSDLKKTSIFIDEFYKSVTITSAFPFFEKENSIKYFFPLPKIFPADLLKLLDNYDEKKRTEFLKDLKKREFIESEIFLRWISGNEISEDLEKLPLEDKIFIKDIRPQNTNDRLTQAASIFFIGLLYFRKNSGLYFIIEKESESNIDWELINKILNICGINGLGGRRTTGNGTFDFELLELPENLKPIFSNNEGNAYLNLSLFYPNILNNLNPLSYEIIPRKGWIYSNITNTQMKRKTCNMFSECSIFKNEPIGSLIDLTPERFDVHKIYRFGKPFNILYKTINC